uniref:Uncharacterized protein n=1 Tax=Theileria annulata TaxID=5874 RepID=A0A3B0MNW1_THEAN
MDNSPITVSDDEESQSLPNNGNELANGTSKDYDQMDSDYTPAPRFLLVDKSSGKDIKKVQKTRKKRYTASKDFLDSIPFWVNSPKDVRDIPSHIKMICERLIHVEKQIKKFCIERQGLLSTLWKLGGDGYINLFPDPVLKSLTFYGVSNGSEENDIYNDEKDSLDSEIEDKLNYNNLYSSKLENGDLKMWKSTWMTNESEASPIKTPTQTPTQIPTIKTFVSNYIKSCGSSSEFGISTGMNDSKKSSYTNESNGSRDSEEYEREPIEFFKNLDFSKLNEADMEAWRKFFGLKVYNYIKMEDEEMVKELVKIREHLLSFIDV